MKALHVLLFAFAVLPAGCAEEPQPENTSVGQRDDAQRQPAGGVAAVARILEDPELPPGFVQGPWPPPPGGGVVVMPPGSLGARTEDVPHYRGK